MLVRLCVFTIDQSYFSYYSASILRLAGFPVEIAIWLVCVPNAVNVLFTFIGIWLVEKAGRRILSIGSLMGKISTGPFSAIHLNLLIDSLFCKHHGSHQTAPVGVVCWGT